MMLVMLPGRTRRYSARLSGFEFCLLDLMRRSGGEVKSVDDPDIVNGISKRYIQDIVAHWSNITAIDTPKLLYTSFRKVESDVGKKKQSDVERVAGLASSLGGGW